MKLKLTSSTLSARQPHNRLGGRPPCRRGKERGPFCRPTSESAWYTGTARKYSKFVCVATHHISLNITSSPLTSSLLKWWDSTAALKCRTHIHYITIVLTVWCRVHKLAISSNRNCLDGDQWVGGQPMGSHRQELETKRTYVRGSYRTIKENDKVRLKQTIFSYFILSYLILSYLILSYLILSYLILSFLTSSYLI